MADEEWRRVGGFRVVLAWRPSAYAPPPGPARGLSVRVMGLIAVFLIVGGAAGLAVAAREQQHAPQPAAGSAGVTGAAGEGGHLGRSVPVSLSIPAAGVHTSLLRLGLTAAGDFQVPALPSQAGKAAWYEYSVTPGQAGVSIIEGHVDSYTGPAVFFRLGALRPGDRVFVKRADDITAVFRVTAVRTYLKANYPASTIYGHPDYAALRLITCGGAFDPATRHYLSSTVVFASLLSASR